MTLTLREIRRIYADPYLAQPELSLARLHQEDMPIRRRVDLVLGSDIDDPDKFKELIYVFRRYLAKDLPAPNELGLCRYTWIVLYWKKRALEIGEELSEEDKLNDFPAEKSSSATEFMDKLINYSLSGGFLPREAIFYWPKVGTSPNPRHSSHTSESCWKCFSYCFTFENRSRLMNN